jgi:hypothetical protein
MMKFWRPRLIATTLLPLTYSKSSLLSRNRYRNCEGTQKKLRKNLNSNSFSMVPIMAPFQVLMYAYRGRCSLPAPKKILLFEYGTILISSAKLQGSSTFQSKPWRLIRFYQWPFILPDIILLLALSIKWDFFIFSRTSSGCTEICRLKVPLWSGLVKAGNL